MPTSKIEWKMVEVEGYLVESTLTDLTDSDYEIFSVQFTGNKWGIVARKFEKNGAGRNCMGFKPPN